MTRALRSLSPLWPLLLALVVGVLTTVALATIRHKVDEGQTVEALAQQYYGDVAKAPIIRAMNKLGDGEQPAAGAFLKMPGSTIHTVQAGENLRKVADRFLSGDGGEDIIAEANGLAKGSALKPGQVLTIPAEIEVRPQGKSAEELAVVYLGDQNLGARVRRYNGVADGGKLPAKVYLPLVGIEPRGGGTVAAAPAPVPANVPVPVPVPVPVLVPPLPVPSLPTPAPVVPTPVATAPVPVAPAPAPVVAPPVAPVAPAPVAPAPIIPAPTLDLSVPVTGKRAALTGFSHALHTPMKIGASTIGCIVCHAHGPDGIAVVAPTQNSCMICHKASDEMPAQLRKGQTKRLPLPMNHRLHVADAGLDCTICHRQEPQRALGIITNGHEACAACHQAGKVAPFVGGDPSGLACTGCHGSVEEFDEGSERTRYLKAHLLRPIGRVGDVVFTHMTHASFSMGGAPGGGPAIECKTCHVDAYTAETKDQISKATMQGCLECHRQANNVGLSPPESCAGCHLNHRSGFMPTNETVLKKPINHTSFFRRRHADAYARDPALCASCHVGTDGTSGARCDTCHMQMKPRDHTAGFRDKVHGRSAQIDPARCTTCHRAERCESCHRETPKSHFPLSNWAEKGRHASRARLELGACLTCHRFETTCTQCHTAAAR